MAITRTMLSEAKKHTTPFLLVDRDKLRKNYRKLKKAMPDVEVFYAMKANDHDEILKVLAEEGAGFEISSLSELEKLQPLRIAPEKIICFNSVKNEPFLKAMEKMGITVMAFDSKEEVDKIKTFAPSAQLVLRITVDNEGSEWPLTKKFGVDAPDALELLQYAESKGLRPIGVTFHVGSQCLNKNNWAKAISVCAEIFTDAEKHGIDLHYISLGGGLPVKHLKEIPDLNDIGKSIAQAMKRDFNGRSNKIRLSIEPGRGLVGDTAVMVTSVVGKAKRGSESWVWIDVGVFNGLIETIQGITYELKTDRKGRRKEVTIAGPSCDSVDVPFKDVMLPEVKIGEKLYILNTGAYTTVYAANFNGFPVPEVHFINK